MDQQVRKDHEEQQDVCPNTQGAHLPRYPVTWLNERAGFKWECAFCGRGLVEVPA